MAKKHLSSFAVFSIVLGLFLILLQFYSIGSEMYKISSNNKVFSDARSELAILRSKKQEKLKMKEIRSTPEYFDRFQKENYDVYQPGEIVLILPPLDITEDPYENLTPLEIEWELRKRKPIDQQWRAIFLK